MMQKRLLSLLLITVAVLGIGLILSGMTDPGKVIGFLDLFGQGLVGEIGVDGGGAKGKRRLQHGQGARRRQQFRCAQGHAQAPSPCIAARPAIARA